MSMHGGNLQAWVGWKPSSPDFRVASTRIRCLIPLGELQAQGYRVELFRPAAASGYRAVVYSKTYHVKDVEEAAALREGGVQIIFDLCDNRFYNPRSIPKANEEIQRLHRMMQIAHFWVASTEALAEVMRAEAVAEKPLVVIGDPLETEVVGVPVTPWARLSQWTAWLKFRRWISAMRQAGRTPLIWFGHHGSPYADGGMLDLERIRGTIERLNPTFPLSLTVVSNSREKYEASIRPWSIPTHYLEWHASTFTRVLRSHDVAIIPVTINPFTWCKSNNRLALSLSSGLAVVADSIPSYEPFREACVLDDWERGLQAYLSSSSRRAVDVARGQSLVTRLCDVRAIAEQWRQVFDRVVCASDVGA